MERKGITITKTNQVISYSSSTADIPLEYFSLRSRLDRMAEKYPNKVVFVFNMNNGLEVTYSYLKTKSYSLAASLVSLGLKKGERIAYILPNTHELVMLYFAASIAGLIAVPLDADYGSSELEYMLNKTEPSAVVVYNCAEYRNLIDNLFPGLNAGRPESFKCERFPNLRHVIVVNEQNNMDNVSFSAALSYSKLTEPHIDFDYGRFPYVDPDDLFAILFTSGTTSKPKGISVRYFSILNNINIQTKLVGFSDDDEDIVPIISCQTTLMYHVGAIFSIIGSMMSLRYQLIFPSYKFNLVDIMHAVQKYKCNSIFCLPKILSNLIDHPQRHEFDLSSIEWMMLGGQFVSAELCQRVANELGVRKIGLGYGMTEVNIISYKWLDLDKTDLGMFSSCVGQPFPYIECKIVNPETGEIQPVNIEGELHLRGYCVTNNYWNDPEITSKLIDKNGWLNTGDIFTMDEEGFLYFKSRSKEIITAKGSGRLDVYPSIVESVLLKHPNIIEAVVFGIPVNIYEQELCAWVRLRSQEMETSVEEVVSFCSQRLIDYQVPRFIKFVQEFPANKMGKYVRVEMSRIFKNELGI